MGSLSFTAETWPEAMRELTPLEAMFAIYRSRGLPLGEASALAGYRPSKQGGWNVENRPHVRRAIAELRALHARKETIRASIHD